MPTKFLRVFFPLAMACVLISKGWGQNNEIFFAKPPGQQESIPAVQIKDKWHVDVGLLTLAMGGEVKRATNGFWLLFPTRKILFLPKQNSYSIYSASPKGGKSPESSHTLADPAVFFNGKYYVSLASLPELLNRRFSFHLQKRVLMEATEQAKENEEFRSLPVRHTMREGKVWVSLHDVGQALGVPVYTQESGRFILVLPDFSILTLIVGDLWIYRRGERYRPMEDVLSSLSGAPHITLPSLEAIFDIEAVWDSERKQLKIPRQYGRLRAFDIPKVPLQMEGYHARPLRLNLEFLSLYHQQPAPIYYASHEDPYESIRDFLSDEPQDSGATGWDSVSGQARVNLEGSLGKQPIEGGATVEKIGTRARLANGGVRWGFPRFQMEAAREYIKMGDFEKQTNLVDFMSVSASNDAYGEGETDPEWKASGIYGQNEFFVYLSTSLFSQSVKFRQEMMGGRLSFINNPGESSSLRATLSEYRFDSKPVETTVGFNYFADIFGEEFIDFIDPGESQALNEEFLSDHHGLTLLDLDYRMSRQWQWLATGGLSRSENPTDGKTALGGSWKLRSIYNKDGSRLDISHERAESDYQSLGDPLRYQGVAVTRLNTYLNISRPFKFFGDIRREDSHGNESVGLEGSRFDYASAGALLYLKRSSNRTLFSHYRHTLYGKRVKVDDDFTRFFGPHALDFGAGWASQWYNTGALYQQSYVGRINARLRFGDLRYSLAEEAITHHYPQRDRNLFESSTRMEVEGSVWKTLAVFGYRPLTPPDRTTLKTIFLRLDRRFSERHIWSVIGSAAGRRSAFDGSDVWRVGLEYTREMF